MPRQQLTPELYGRLRARAAALFAGSPPQTLQPTELVHEVYERFARGDHTFSSETHFRIVAAAAMRQILVDHARRRHAAKRGGGARAVTLTTVADPNEPAVELLDLHRALELLEQTDPERARIVELHFFGGLTIDKIATDQGLSVRTVERRWRAARAWLALQLG